MRTVLICAWRALRVVTFGALINLTPCRCSRARMTTRSCGSVRIPVSVPSAGALLRNPEVRRLSVAEAGMVPGLGVNTPGLNGSLEYGPGNNPDGFAAGTE